MTRRHSRPLFVILPVLVCALALVGVSTHAQRGAAMQASPQPARPFRVPALNAAVVQGSPLLRGIDDESALFNKLNAQTIVGRGRLAQGYSAKTVALEDGRTVALGDLTRQFMAAQNALAAQAIRASASGVLTRPVATEEEVVEFDDAYAVVQVTTMTVADPERLARDSAAFRIYRGRALVPATLTRESLKPESRPGFDEFLRRELPELPGDDPLRRAYESGGASGLLKAIAQGQGTLEVMDTLFVPKVFDPLVGGRIQRPVIENGVVRYNRHLPVGGRLQMTSVVAADRAEGAGHTDAPVAEPPRLAASVVARGSDRFETSFLAGFTKSRSWEWERRWRFPSGFFRLTLRGHYGFGLRIPIRVSGTVSPTQVTVKDARDQIVPARVSLTAQTIDADRAFFEEVGLRGDAFKGQEAICEAGFGWGLKFRALWSDIVHVRTHDIDAFDLSRDFKPPFGRDADAFYRLEIPASATGTEFSWGAVSGFAQAGLRFDGKGTVKLDAQPFVGDRELAVQHLRFSDAGARPVDFLLPALPLTRGAQAAQAPFGIILDNPAYSVDLSVTPQIKAEVTVGYDWVSHTFDTGWMSLDAFKIHLGVLSLSHHTGTRASFRWEAGRKTFEHLENAVSSVAAPYRAAILSAHSGRYVRAGVGELSLLSATSDRAGGWESFEIVTLGQGLVALKSIQSGKFVRIGVRDRNRERMAASSPRADVLETFRLIDLGSGGRVALQAIHTNKFVRAGLEQDSYLAAVSSEIGAWEQFVIRKLESPAAPSRR